MNPLLEALAQTPPAVFLRSSLYIYPLVSALHVLSIGALLTCVILMDLCVLGWRGNVGVERAVAWLRPVATAGLLAAIVSGALLFSVQPVDYFENLAFRFKLPLIAAALVNAIVFAVLRLHRRPRRVLTRTLAAASIALWLAAVLAGRFIGFM